MATLKISDLSVGDWVYSDLDEENMRVVVIYGDNERIIAQNSSGRGANFPLDYFSPIPITAEMLKKNGFARGQRGDFYHYLRLDKNRTLYIHASTNGWRVEITYDTAGILRTTHLMPDMNSVHELQHALRLAGVDKEINL